MAEFLSVGMLTQPLHHFGSHRHEVWEIIYYTHGTGIALLGSVSIPFQPGTVICMPPQVPQEEHSASGYRNIHILARDVSGLREPIPVFRDKPGLPFLHLASLLHAEMHTGRPASRLIAQSLFDTLMLYMRRWDQVTIRITAVEQLRHRIAECFHQPGFRVETAMDRIPVSKDHLRRLFSARNRCHTRGISPPIACRTLQATPGRGFYGKGGSLARGTERPLLFFTTVPQAHRAIASDLQTRHRLAARPAPNELSRLFARRIWGSLRFPTSSKPIPPFRPG